MKLAALKGMLRSFFLLVLLHASMPVAMATDLPNATSWRCMQNGGPYACVEQQPTAWVYHTCDDSWSGSANWAKWCTVEGGTPGGAGPYTCPGSTPYTSQNLMPRTLQFADLWLGPGTQLVSETGWEHNAQSVYGCWDGPPQYSLGVLVRSVKRLDFSGPQSQTGTVYWGKFRDPACPIGSSSITENDKMYCWRVQYGTCCIDNPMHPDTGMKVHSEMDIAAGGLTLTRYYSTIGLHVPVGSSVPAAATPWGPNWAHDYDARVYPIAGSATVMAVASRPDGQLINFDANGQPLEMVPNQLPRLARIESGGVLQGWEYSDGSGRVERYDAAGALTGVSKRDGTRITVTREIDGKILSVSDERGREIAFTYDSTGMLITLEGPDGASVDYGFDGRENLTSATFSTGTSREYRYEDNRSTRLAHLLTSIVDETGSRYAQYKYYYYPSEIDGALTEESHGPDMPGGGVDKIIYNYDPWRPYAYTERVDPNGSVSVMTFETRGRVRKMASATAPCATCGSRVASYEYDANGWPSAEVDFEGHRKTFSYDAGGLLLETVEATGASSQRKIQTDWNASLRVPAERRIYDASNTLLAKSTWTYNTRGQALTSTQTNPATSTTRTTTTTYCEAADITNGTCPLLGLVTSINGPRTDVTDTTTYTYYASDEASCASSPTTCPHRKGDLWKVTDALGRITETLAYDGAGRVLSVKDANNVVTDFTYHPRGWLTARKVRGTNNASETDDQITTIEYWPTGLVKKVTQPDGAFTAYTYDAAHRLTDIADNAGNTIHYTLDNAGNRTAEATKDAGNVLRRSLSRVYNQLGQLQTAKDAYNHATGFTYDANGNNQTVTDALNRVADNDYDPLNRLVRTLQDVGGIEAETKFAYDAQDNLTKVTDPKGLDTTYTYNGFSDLTQLSSPDTGVTTYTYDSAGNRKTQTDARNITATYSYDALNRLTGIAYPTSSLDVAYVYDTVNAACLAGETFAVGRLTKMIDGSGNTEYCYDRFGHLTRKRQTTNGQVFELRYAYTKAGQLQALAYPDGAVVDYVRDGQGRTTEVGVTPSGGTRAVLLNQATYYPFGPIAGWTYGNGRTMTRTLNQNYQPLAIEDPNAGGLSLGYAFDEVGNLKTLYNADQSIAKAQYGYDGLNRLTDVKDGPTGTVIDHYAYDATGNRTSFTNAGGTTNYTYPSSNHRLTNVGGTARTYDNVGNTTQIGGTAKEFVYNDAGRMSQVKVGGTPTMNYALSGRGEQVRKYLASSNTYTVYNEAGQWIGDYDGSGNPIQQAVWLDDLPVGLLAGATTNQKLHYLQPDHLGTPRAVVDTTVNTAIWRWDLEGDAFGTTVPNQDPDGSGTAFIFSMRFPGHRYDATSGINYNYFRDGYDAGSGRYTQSDPIGRAGGPSTYGYAHQSPGVNVDYFGLKSCQVVTKSEWMVPIEQDIPVGDPSRIYWPIIKVSFVPGAADMLPDPITGRISFPVGPELVGVGTIYKQKYVREILHRIRDQIWEVCEDDCGRRTSRLIKYLDPRVGYRETIKGVHSHWHRGSINPVEDFDSIP